MSDEDNKPSKPDTTTRPPRKPAMKMIKKYSRATPSESKNKPKK